MNGSDRGWRLTITRHPRSTTKLCNVACMAAFFLNLISLPPKLLCCDLVVPLAIMNEDKEFKDAEMGDDSQQLLRGSGSTLEEISERRRESRELFALWLRNSPEYWDPPSSGLSGDLQEDSAEDFIETDPEGVPFDSSGWYCRSESPLLFEGERTGDLWDRDAREEAGTAIRSREHSNDACRGCQRCADCGCFFCPMDPVQQELQSLSPTYNSADLERYFPIN